MTSRAWIASALLLAGLPDTVSARADEKVPDETRELLRELRAFELEERTEVEERIARERDRTIEQLQRQPEGYTKGGDLETANAILAEIKRLQSDERRPPTGMTFDLPWSSDGKRGSVLVTFHGDGTATWDNKVVDVTFDKGFKWSVESPGVVELWYKSKEKGSGLQWRFSDNYSSARVRDRGRDETVNALRIE